MRMVDCVCFAYRGIPWAVQWAKGSIDSTNMCYIREENPVGVYWTSILCNNNIAKSLPRLAPKKMLRGSKYFRILRIIANTVCLL